MSNIFVTYHPHVVKHYVRKAAMVTKESLSLALSASHTHTLTHIDIHKRKFLAPSFLNCSSVFQQKCQ